MYCNLHIGVVYMYNLYACSFAMMIVHSLLLNILEMVANWQALMLDVFVCMRVCVCVCTYACQE